MAPPSRETHLQQGTTSIFSSQTYNHHQITLDTDCTIQTNEWPTANNQEWPNQLVHKPTQLTTTLLANTTFLTLPLTPRNMLQTSLFIKNHLLSPHSIIREKKKSKSQPTETSQTTLLQGSANNCQSALQLLLHHLLHEGNECSTTDFTMELRRYNYILHKFLADRADLFG